MLKTVLSISSLLLGAALLLIGNGLAGTLLALRGSLVGWSDGLIGLIMSAYFAGFLSGTYIAPVVILRVGHIRAFALFAAVAAATALLHALFVNPIAWAALRIVTGSCLVGLYMVIESWLNTQAPAGQRSRVFATYMAVNFLALAIGQNLIQLYAPSGFEPFAIVAILLSLSLVPIMLTRVSQPVPVQQPRLRWHTLYRASPSAISGAFGSGLAMSAFWGLAPVMAQHLLGNSAGIAALMTATILGGALVQWPVGYWSDHVDRRRMLAMLAGGASLLALLAFAIGDLAPWLLYATMFAFGGLAFTIYPVSIALANDFLAREDTLQGASTMLFVHGIGAAAGPSVAGLLMLLCGPRGLLLHFAVVLAVLAVSVWLRILRSGYVALPQEHFTPMLRTSTAALELITEPENKEHRV